MSWIERRRVLWIAAAAFTGLVAVSSRRGQSSEESGDVDIMEFSDAGQPIGPRRLPRLVLSSAEWRARLSAQQYYVTRHGSTDTPYTGTYHSLHAPGLYRCIGCGTALFRSEDKFDSHTGWPSFSAPIDPRNIRARTDVELLMERTEIACRRCLAHLGHVFSDGPAPTGLRYCINESSLRFVPR